ncbi:FG-GAP-like repeat-containing protein [Micromonospora sp. DT228]|uniref:FG-GAP-like repeat-containing protein n=1 Tax=Micromonospora sp. DT228 TaxID=3393443 RepID=UPI003CF51581
MRRSGALRPRPKSAVLARLRISTAMIVVAALIGGGLAAPAQAVPDRAPATLPAQVPMGPLGSMTVEAADDDIVFTLDLGETVDVARVREAASEFQGRGPAFGSTFQAETQANPPGATYPGMDSWPDFDGTISVTEAELSLTVTRPEVQTDAGWLAQILATGAGVTVLIVSRALCVGALVAITSPLVLPVAKPVCAFVGTFLGNLTRGGILIAVDGGTLDGSVWAHLIVAGIIQAAGAAAWESGIGHWAETTLPGYLERAGNGVVTLATKVGRWFASFKPALIQAGTWLREHVTDVRRAVDEVGMADVPLRVMPMGDSITYGVSSSTGSGYRSGLHSALTAQGGQVEFVGSQRSGPAPNAHEGHSGWRIADIAGIADSVLSTYRPNVVLLHIGTNDMHQNGEPAGAPGRLGSLIDQIFRAVPQVTLLVSTIVPSGNSATQARIAAFNQAVPGLVATRRADGKHVYLVSMSAVTTSDLADGIHPNDAGYRKMSAEFYRGVLAVADAGWIVAPGAVTPTAAPVRAWNYQGVVAPGTMSRDSYPGSLSLGSGDKVLFGDVDGDGRDDYLVSHSDGSVNVWVNGGAGLDGTIAWIGHGSSGFPYAPGFLWQTADMNVDGRADLVQINPNTGSLGLYVNGGTDSQGRYIWNSAGQIVPSLDAPGSQVRLADINDDGRPDYLWVRPDSSVLAWLIGRTGAGVWGWFKQGEIAAGVSSPGNQIRFADLNGDGKADYLDIGPDSSIRAWLNGATDTDFHTVPPNLRWSSQGVVAPGVGSPGGQIQLADLDGDRKADYLDVDPVTGGIRMWKNSGAAPGGGWQWASRGSVATGNHARVVYADLNGDRRVDYLEVSADSSVKAWLNGGSQGNGARAWNFVGTVATGVGVPGSNVRFADISGDGKADYLAVDADSSVEGWINGGPGNGGGWVFNSQGIVATGVGSPGGQIRFADVNGDGKADYLDVAPDSSVEAWLSVGASSGGGWRWTSIDTVAVGVHVAGTSVRFAPLYGTARADYIALGDNGTIDVWQNGGRNGNGNWLWLNGGKVADGVGSPGNQIQLADINGDGRADYLDVDPATGATRAWTNAS